MKVFRSKKDNKLYVLSINKAPKFTGEWIECMLYKNYPNGEWKEANKKDFVEKFER